jgi:hypothetical protein
MKKQAIVLWGNISSGIIKARFISKSMGIQMIVCWKYNSILVWFGNFNLLQIAIQVVTCLQRRCQFHNND